MLSLASVLTDRPWSRSMTGDPWADLVVRDSRDPIATSGLWPLSALASRRFTIYQWCRLVPVHDAAPNRASPGSRPVRQTKHGMGDVIERLRRASRTLQTGTSPASDRRIAR